MRDPLNVLIKPVVSEKTYALMENKVYVFVIAPSATKIDVRHAVEQTFGVTVSKVNTLHRRGKSTLNRRTGVRGRRPNSKRAIVTLAPGHSINLFES
jgi:large subunit ribosomal protein L23